MITVSNILDCEQYLDGMDAVVFDLDDTLYSEKDYVRSGYRAVAGAFPQIPDMERKLWAAFEARMPAIDAVLDDPKEREKALRIYRGHTPEISLYPGVRELLERLRKTKKLGLITDGRPEGQRAKLRALRIGDLFDKIIITDELGGPEYRKPNEAAFQLMQACLQVPFEKMAYIGDNAQKDFSAPQSLGMLAVYFCNQDGLYTE